MTNASTSAKISDGAATAAAGELRFVARQPILDLHGRVHAFKLLFRGELDADGESSGQTVLDTAAYFGFHKPSELKRLTGNLMAFVHCSEQMLNEPLEHFFAASLTVLEVDARQDPSSDFIAACQRMKSLDFRLALDNFAWHENSEPLLDLADYVQVDFSRTLPEERSELLARLQDKTPSLLAKKVETQAEYRQACEEGFRLFEGYYFCQQVESRNRRPPANQMLRLEILKALQHHPMDLPKISDLVKRDGPLAYQLLRLVNSPMYAMRQTVESIQTALMAVGEDTFRRIAMLAIAAQFNGDQPAELLCMAIVRGRFCELCAGQRCLDPFEQYLLGLMSLLPAMQGQSMDVVAPTLPLKETIREALMGKDNSERALLSWLESCERGDWRRCDAVAQTNGLDQLEMAKIYLESVAWAEAMLY